MVRVAARDGRRARQRFSAEFVRAAVDLSAARGVLRVMHALGDADLGVEPGLRRLVVRASGIPSCTASLGASGHCVGGGGARPVNIKLPAHTTSSLCMPGGRLTMS